MRRFFVVVGCVLAASAASAQEYEPPTPTDPSQAQMQEAVEAPKEFIIDLARDCKMQNKQDITGMALCMQKRKSEIDAVVKASEERQKELTQAQLKKYEEERERKKEEEKIKEVTAEDPKDSVYKEVAPDVNALHRNVKP
jgi:hypothetical protein